MVTKVSMKCIFSHNNIRMHSRMHPIEPLIKKISRKIEHAPEFLINKVAQRYMHRTTTQGECITITPHYVKNYTPMFEHGFLPLINDYIHSGTRPSPDNHRVCVHNAMLAFLQEKISH